MKGYFAYVRVSSAKQGEGVSLIEQRAAIERYAKAHQLPIKEWFEETETAAKRGRAVFRTIMSRLGRREAAGLIIHKIDRGARNLRDWADLGELIDQGADIRFVHDNLDLGSRGGRLAADIQAVIAADYIRNLRDEVKKGMYGRLRQGLYPLPAPLGYLDRGKGRMKVLDPAKAPLVVEAFERYATGTYTLRELRRILQARGLTNRGGRNLSVNNLSLLLNNPFYTGIMRLRTTGETFPGIHEPLITRALFEQAALVLRGRRPKTRVTHQFTYRGLVFCSGCNRHLIAEIKKERYIYYRCHSPSCRGTLLREELIEATIGSALKPLRIPPSLELDILLAPLLEHWRREAWRLNLLAHTGREQEISPRLAEAFARTPSAARYSQERMQGFKEFIATPAVVFERAPAMQRRELVQLTLRLSTSYKEPQGTIRAPFIDL